MSAPIDRLVAALESAGCNPRRSGEGWSARCPGPGHAHGDRNPSLSAWEKDGAAWLKCHAGQGCAKEAILAPLRLTLADLFPQRATTNGAPTRHDYVDEGGKVLMTVCRLGHGAAKKVWRQPGGVRDVPLYRLPEVLAAEGRKIFVVEGEKCADAVVRAGAVATCSPGGAGKWRSEHTRALEGASEIVVVADHDQPGIDHARAVVEALVGVGVNARAFLPARRRPTADGYDIADQLAEGGTLEDLDPMPDGIDEEQDGSAEPSYSSKANVDLPVETAVVIRVADVATERVRWLWRGRLPRGKLVVLDGDPALGKSTLMLDIAARITTGSPMPDGEPAAGPENVLVMTAEDGIADTVRPRLEAADADLSRVLMFEEVMMVDGTTRPPSVPMDIHHVEDLVTAHGVALVVIDVLNAYLSSKVDGYRDQDVRGALHPLARMGERTGATVVCLRHLSKSGGANAIYRGGGSIGIIGGARAGLLVAPDPEDDSRRVLAVSKSNLAAKPPSLAYRLVSDQLRDVARVVWEGKVDYTADGLLVSREEERTGDGEADAAEVLTGILDDGPLWVAEAIKAMGTAGFTKDQARRAKDKVARSVKVGKPGDAEQGWQWTLRETTRHPEDGSHPPEDGEDGSSQNPATFATFATSLPSSGLADLPLDEVGACRVCAGATATADAGGPIHARCREAS